MADLPITSDEGGMPVIITDANTTTSTVLVEPDGSIYAANALELDVAAGKGFSVVSEVLPGAATETPVFLIKNPVGSGKKMKVSLLIFGISPSVGSATGNTDLFRLYADPTITTNGTALTINNLDTQTGPPASAMTAFSSPTVTANGTKLGTYCVSSQAGSLTIPQNASRVLDVGHNWLITQVGIVNGAATGIIQLEWIED
jgi:hypothetical protein